MKTFWVSWYSAGEFEWQGPWWISGYRILLHDDDSDQATFCAAVHAPDEDTARLLIEMAHDDKDVEIEWRFVSEKDETFDPLNLGEKFPAAGWMRWPWPALEDAS